MLFENSVNEVLSEMKKSVAKVLPIEIDNIDNEVSLFSMGCDYYDMLEISHDIEGSILCLPITFDWSNFHELSIKSIYDQVINAKLSVCEKVKEFFKKFYKDTFGKDCPEISSDENEIIKDFSFESLDVADLRMAAEEAFNIKLDPAPIDVNLKIGSFSREIFEGLVKRTKEAYSIAI